MTRAPDPFAHARAAWEDRHGVLATERERWFRAFLAMAAVATLTTLFGIWAAVRSEYIPYIVAVDDIGQARAVLAPREISDWPDHAVRREVADFLRDWRSVSTDTGVMRARLRRIQYYLEESSAANRKVVAWARDPNTDPFARSEVATVDVEIRAVNFVGGRSWLAEWLETRRNRNTGNVEKITGYQGTFVLGQRRVTDETVLINNPFGMVIEDIDIVRLAQ